MSLLSALFGRDPALPDREDYASHALSASHPSVETVGETTRCDTQLLLSKIIYEETYLSPWQDADFWIRCKSMRIARMLLGQLESRQLLRTESVFSTREGASSGARSGERRPGTEPVEILRYD